jgi:AcrR family transcriptional regulator
VAVHKRPDPNRRNESSRQAILVAATDLICEVGFQKLAVEAIAARAGVGKQTIYRWWPDKGAVVFDAYLALVGADSPDTEPGSGMPDSGDIEADLKLVVRFIVDNFADARYEAAYRALLLAIQADPKLDQQLTERVLRPTLEAAKDRLRSAQKAGQIGEADLDTVVELIFGAVYYRWLLHLGPLSGEYSDGVVSLVLRSLRP